MSTSCRVWSALVIALLVSFAVVNAVRAAVDDDDLTGFPERPSVFRSPEELKEYLRALNEYFAIAGRPRFGRSADRLFNKYSSRSSKLHSN